MAQVEGIVEKTLVKKSLDSNIGTITLDNPPKHNALGAALSSLESFGAANPRPPSGSFV